MKTILLFLLTASFTFGGVVTFTNTVGSSSFSVNAGGDGGSFTNLNYANISTAQRINSGDPIITYDPQFEFGPIIYNRANHKPFQNNSILVCPPYSNFGKAGGSATYLSGCVDTNAVGPFGNYDASYISVAAGGNSGGLTLNPAPVAGDNVTQSIYCMAANGTNELFQFGSFPSGPYSPVLTITTNWQRFVCTFTNISGPLSSYIGFGSPTNGSVATYAYIWGLQCEIGDGVVSNAPASVSSIPDLFFDLYARQNTPPVRTNGWLDFSSTSYMTSGTKTPAKFPSATIHIIAKKNVESYAAVSAGVNPLIMEDGGTRLQLYGQSGFVFNGLSSGAGNYALNDGTWHLITASTDRSNIFYWVDDVLVASNLTSTAKKTIDIKKLCLGSWNATMFNGLIAYADALPTAVNFQQVSNDFYYYKQVAALRGVTLNTYPRRIICEGDSITVGSGVSGYPTLLATNLLLAVPVINLAVSGSTITNVIGRTNASFNYGISFEPSNRTNIWTLLIGANDLNVTAPANTNNFFSALTNQCQLMRNRGFKVTICTIISHTNFSNVNFENDRLALNARIRTTTGWYDSIADFGNDPSMGSINAYTNSTYFQSDSVHPTAAGELILSGILRTNLSSVYGF